MRKIIARIPKKKIVTIGSYVEKCTAGHICTTFEGLILIYEGIIAKNEFHLLLAIKYVKMTQLRWKSLDMPYHLLNVYTKFKIDISEHVEKS